MRDIQLGLAILASLAMCGSNACAQTFPAYVSGYIGRFYADPTDIVLEMSQNGPCGSGVFVVSRSATNFQEMTALMLTAAASRNQINLTVTGCNSNRNLVSHGSAFF